MECDKMPFRSHTNSQFWVAHCSSSR